VLSTRVDVKSGQQIDVPTDDAGVLKLGENVVRAEELLPTAKQFPRLDLIRQRLQAGKVGLDKFYAARADGSAVSVSVEQGLVDAKGAVQKIISGLTYLHLHELPVLEQWGIDVRQTSRGPKCLFKKSRLIGFDSNCEVNFACFEVLALSGHRSTHG